MRSLLIVPADNTKKIDAAMASGADAVVLDVEDSVAYENKPRARDNIRAILAGKHDDTGPEIIVRLNALDEAEFNADMVALLDTPPEAFMLPKAEGAECLNRLARHAGPVPVIAIAAETPAGVLKLHTFAEDTPANLMGLTWGAEDLSAQLCAATNHDDDGHLTDPYRFARSLCLFAARAANAEPIDTVFVRYTDEEGLKRSCANAFRDGYTGKLAIHPSQVPIINAAFTPTQEQIAKARRVVAAFEAKPNAGVVSVNGKMFDRPNLLRAQRLLKKVSKYGV
jgi:citrate lyase subunit beta/citryl-CoA lyase